MKTIRMLSVVVLFTVLAGGSAPVLAQCVVCGVSKRNPDILVCKSGSEGGSECHSDGQTCAIIGACPGSRPPFGQLRQWQQAARRFVVDESMIREISGVHPRFAYALAYLRSRDFLSRDTKIFMLPRPITERDIEEEMSPPRRRLPLESSLSLRNQHDGLSMMRRLNPPRRTPEELVVYNVLVEEVTDSLVTLRIEVEKAGVSDPALTVLEIDLIPKGDRWHASSWRVH